MTLAPFPETFNRRTTYESFECVYCGTHKHFFRWTVKFQPKRWWRPARVRFSCTLCGGVHYTQPRKSAPDSAGKEKGT